MPELKDIDDPNFKEKIIALLSSMWGESQVAAFRKYYEDKSNEETYNSAFKLLRVYYGEEAAERLLEKPKDLNVVEEKLRLSDYVDTRFYVLGIVSLFLFAFFYMYPKGEYYGIVSMVLKFAIPLLPIYFGYHMYKLYGESSSHGQTIMYMTLPMLLFYIADISGLYSFNWFSSSIVMIGQIMLLFSFFYSIRIFDPHYGFLKEPKKLIMLNVLITFSIIAYFAFFSFLSDARGGFFPNFFSFGLVLNDVLLILSLFIVISLVLFSRYDIFMIILLLFVTLGFMTHVNLALNHQYFLPGIVDFLILMKFMVFAIGAVMLDNITKETLEEYIK